MNMGCCVVRDQVAECDVDFHYVRCDIQQNSCEACPRRCRGRISLAALRVAVKVIGAAKPGTAIPTISTTGTAYLRIELYRLITGYSLLPIESNSSATFSVIAFKPEASPNLVSNESVRACFFFVDKPCHFKMGNA